MTSGDRLAWFEAPLEQAGTTINLVTIYRTLNELTQATLPNHFQVTYHTLVLQVSVSAARPSSA